MKNYIENENATLSVLLSFKEMESLRRICKYLPPHIELFQDLHNYLHNIYIHTAADRGYFCGQLRRHVIYDLPNVPMLEIKRTSNMSTSFTYQIFLDTIVVPCLHGVERDNGKILSVLFDKFCTLNRSPQGRNGYNSFHRYLKEEWFISSSFNDPFFRTRIKEVTDLCEANTSATDKEHIESDLNELFSILHPSPDSIQQRVVDISDKVLHLSYYDMSVIF